MKRTETPTMPEDIIATAASTVLGGNVSPATEMTPSASQPTDPSSNQSSGLSPAVQKHIGNLLKVSYQDLLTEPVPDRFADLLNQLELAEKKNSGEGK